jgi:hypothetical protein
MKPAVGGSARGGATPVPGGHRRQPSSVKVDKETVRVFDPDGSLLFEHRFQFALNEMIYREFDPIVGRFTRVHVGDLDGDGVREVAFAATALLSQDADRAVVFEADGRVRFSVRPTPTVRFGDETYAPPWRTHHLFVTDSPDRVTLWVVWIHESGQFPCLLQQLSSRGEVLSEFWSAGYVELVAEVTVGGRRLVAVGGANNDHKGAGLAFFNPEAVSGASPAESHDKTCMDCPPGGLLAYLVFPGMAIDRVSHLIPTISRMRRSADGTLVVDVTHQGELQGRNYPGSVMYWLTPALVPRRAEIVGSYVNVHRDLHLAGPLDRPFGERDMREAWPVLVWKGGKRFDPVYGITTR